MKYTMIWIMLFVSCVMAMGEVSKNRLKDLRRLVKIDSVRTSTDKHKNSKTEVLEFEFSSEVEGLDEVVVRVAVEVTDKTKKTYLVEKTRSSGNFPGTYIGEGSWDLTIPQGNLERLKITGYAFEYGVMDGNKFVPFRGEYDDVKTYQELTSRTTTPFPAETQLSRTIWVDPR